MSGSHPERVAACFDRDSDEYRVALFHDAIEDGDDVPDDVRAHVIVLTRRPDEPYRVYIERVRTSGDSVAIAVKLADARDNLARCEGKFDGRIDSNLGNRYRYVIKQLGGIVP